MVFSYYFLPSVLPDAQLLLWVSKITRSRNMGFFLFDCLLPQKLPRHKAKIHGKRQQAFPVDHARIAGNTPRFIQFYLIAAGSSKYLLAALCTEICLQDSWPPLLCSLLSLLFYCIEYPAFHPEFPIQNDAFSLG